MTAETTETQTMEQRIKAHLATEGDPFVQVTTYGRSVVYKRKHADMFRTNAKGELFVQRGKNWDCLGKDGNMVGIRFGRFVAKTK